MKEKKKKKKRKTEVSHSNEQKTLEKEPRCCPQRACKHEPMVKKVQGNCIVNNHGGSSFVLNKVLFANLSIKGF